MQIGVGGAGLAGKAEMDMCAWSKRDVDAVAQIVWCGSVRN